VLPLPEREKPTLIEKIVQGIFRQAISSVGRFAENYARRMLRMVALVLAGIVIAVLGIAFLAVGTVKWFAIMMPSWLGWLVVGIVLLLLGIALTLIALVTRS